MLAVLFIITAIVLSIPKDEWRIRMIYAIGTQTEYKIIGIEPGAGLMELTKTL